MNILGMVISYGGFLLEALLIVRGAGIKVFKTFPLFYSYLIYDFFCSLGLYLIYWFHPQIYPSAYWIYDLVGILVQFMVLIEISDQIFRPFPAIRNLGRALTVLIAAALGFFYILPAILWPSGGSRVLLSFGLRASVTRAIILVVLFYMARHYGSPLGRNTGGLMLGFSIYVATNIAIMACAKEFGPALFARFFWFMLPLSSMLSMLVWNISLWELAPIPSLGIISVTPGRDSEAVALELNRLDSELSRVLHK